MLIKRKKGNKKEDKNKTTIGGLILKNKLIRKLLFHRSSTKDFVRVMEPRARPEAEIEKIWEKRIGIIAVLAISAILMWVICFTSDPPEGRLSDGNRLARPAEAEDVTLRVSGDSETGRWEKLFSFSLDERMFTDEEKERIEKRINDYVGEKLPGKNTSLDSVENKLSFVKNVPGTEAVLEYEYDDRYLKADGTPVQKNIAKEGIDTEIRVKAKWKNYTGEFNYSIHLIPSVVSDSKAVIADAKKQIKRSIKQQATKDTIELPKEYTYSEDEPEKDYMPVFIILGVICALPFLWREQEKRKVSSREDQLISDHPGFINKVMLLLGAGLTLRYAIERISGEYERELSCGGEKHFVYEELCVTMQELKDGVSEGQAIENFGKRCRSMPYMRFASVVTQNLRKGAEGILTILEKEASESLMERKQAALRRGEVAGTKLLFPMMVMLGLVMAIIMVPAFMSM